MAILAVGLSGAWLATRGTYWALFAGAFLFQAQSVLDGCDGEMSRVTYRGSLVGEWLDTIGDDLTNYCFLPGRHWDFIRALAAPFYLAAGAVTVFAGITTSLIEYRYLAKNRLRRSAQVSGEPDGVRRRRPRGKGSAALQARHVRLPHFDCGRRESARPADRRVFARLGRYSRERARHGGANGPRETRWWKPGVSATRQHPRIGGERR